MNLYNLFNRTRATGINRSYGHTNNRITTTRHKKKAAKKHPMLHEKSPWFHYDGGKSSNNYWQ